MPIYEYECTACGHRMEVLQKIHDAPLSTCESCSKPTLKKLMSASVFRLAGKGWYETDFKTGAKRNLVETQGAGDGNKNKGEAKGGEAKGGEAKGGEAKSSTAKSQTETGQKAAGSGNKKPAASGRG